MKKLLFRYWLFKILAYWILCLFPSNVLYFFQVKVIKRNSLQIESLNDDFKFFSKKIELYSNKNDKIKLLEFGAGKNLALSIYLAFIFPNIHQTVIDINDMFDDDLFFDAYQNISKIFNLKAKYNKNEKDLLLKSLRITYVSPMNILHLKSYNEFDYCISRDTLEHIPKVQLNKIIKKITQLLKNTGYMIHKIDYSDHYSNNYNNLSKLNFLKFSDFFWFFLNPSNHYQNRLRHQEYIEIIKMNDFRIIEEKKTVLDNVSFKVDNKFKNFLKNDLLSTSGKIVSNKNS